MKFLIKTAFFVTDIFWGAYNLALFFAACFLLFSAKTGGLFWWPREVFLVSPVLFLLVLSMSYSGFVLSASVLFNFKEKSGLVFKNAGKYLLGFFFALGGILCLVYELGRISYASAIIWEMKKVEFVFGLGLRKLAVFVPLVIVGAYVWFFSREKSLNIVVLRGKSRLNRFLLLSIPVVWLLVGLFWMVGYFQNRCVNPGSGQAEREANFVFYGLKNNERHYWISSIDYDRETQEIWGRIASRNNSHLPLLIQQKRNEGSNWEEILKYA